MFPPNKVANERVEQVTRSVYVCVCVFSQPFCEQQLFDLESDDT